MLTEILAQLKNTLRQAGDFPTPQQLQPLFWSLTTEVSRITKAYLDKEDPLLISLRGAHLRLDFGFCFPLSPMDMQQITQLLGSTENSTVIDEIRFSHCNLSSWHLAMLAQTWPPNSKVHCLSLSYNAYIFAECTYLNPYAMLSFLMKKAKNLTHINLYDNGFIAPGLWILIQALADSKVMIRLSPLLEELPLDSPLTIIAADDSPLPDSTIHFKRVRLLFNTIDKLNWVNEATVLQQKLRNENLEPIIAADIGEQLEMLFAHEKFKALSTELPYLKSLLESAADQKAESIERCLDNNLRRQKGILLDNLTRQLKTLSAVDGVPTPIFSTGGEFPSLQKLAATAIVVKSVRPDGRKLPENMIEYLEQHVWLSSEEYCLLHRIQIPSVETQALQKMWCGFHLMPGEAPPPPKAAQDKPKVSQSHHTARRHPHRHLHHQSHAAGPSSATTEHEQRHKTHSRRRKR